MHMLFIISCTDWTGQTFIFLLLSRHSTRDQQQRFASHKKSKDLKHYGRLSTSLLLSVTFQFDLLGQRPFNGMTAVGDVTPRDGQNNNNKKKKGFMDPNPPWSSISSSSQFHCFVFNWNKSFINGLASLIALLLAYVVRWCSSVTV